MAGRRGWAQQADLLDRAESSTVRTRVADWPGRPGSQLEMGILYRYDALGRRMSYLYDGLSFNIKEQKYNDPKLKNKHTDITPAESIGELPATNDQAGQLQRRIRLGQGIKQVFEKREMVESKDSDQEALRIVNFKPKPLRTACRVRIVGLPFSDKERYKC